MKRCIALIALAALGGGCGGTSETVVAPDGGAAPDGITVGVMPKLRPIPYFLACEKGVYEARDELGVEVFYDGPDTNDVQKQVQMLEIWNNKRYDAIAVAPNDPDAIAPVLEKARKRGAKIVTWDADAKASARDYFVNQAANDAIAKSLLDLVAEEVGPEANYIILTGSLTAANQIIWINEIETYRAAAYPGMTNLSDTPKATEEDQALATQVATDVLKTYPDLDAIVAITSVALPGAAEALRKEGRAQDIFLTGLATPNTMREYVKDGTVRKFVLWDTADLGYLTTYVAAALARGELQAGAMSFNAGRLGEVEVRGEEIILGPPIVFSMDNIDDYDF